MTQCRAQANAWTQQQERSTSLKYSIEGLRLQLAAAESACNQATVQRDAQTTARNSVEAILQGYCLDRGQFFEGRALLEVESDLNVASQRAKSALETAQAAVQKADSDVARLEEAVRQSTNLLEQHRANQGQASAELDSWLADFNVMQSGTADAPVLSLAELQALLAIDATWIAAERAALQAMVRACSVLRLHRSGVYREDVRRRCLVAPAVRLPRPAPPLALSEAERQVLRDVLCGERFADCAPPTIYATLLDEGTYLASVRTMYRLLAVDGQARERRNQLTHPVYAKPELLATGPNQIWSWDITKVKGPVKWTYYHLYVILDIFSRYVAI